MGRALPEDIGPYLDIAYHCREHSHESYLPCPYPDCPHGMDQDDFSVSFTHLGEKRFQRGHYPDIEGRLQYFWLEDAGALFNAERRARMQIRRLTDDGASKPLEMFHYTSAAALLGVIQSQEFWLTDYSYLNDYREVQHGLDLANSTLEQPFVRNSYDADVLASAQTTLADLSQTRIAVACFSEVSDSLPQWRAYGDVAIGIRLSGDPLGYAPGCVLDRVVYDETIQRRALEITIHEHAMSYTIDRQRNERATAALAGEMLASRLMSAIVFFKDPAYREELELRYCLVENARVNAKLGLNLAPKRFRHSGSLVMPFVGSSELHIRGPRQRLPISSVVIGPGSNADLLARGVRELLDANGYEDASVYRSKVPYRRV